MAKVFLNESENVCLLFWKSGRFSAHYTYAVNTFYKYFVH